MLAGREVDTAAKNLVAGNGGPRQRSSAREAVDAVYTRIGASDRISRDREEFHTNSATPQFQIWKILEACCVCLQGGKSTVLRTTCLLAIMAHIGAPVPAKTLTLSPVDAVYTRIGASDRIMSGESTFMLECNECSMILQNVTPNSLVIFDELGRGTSTFDGYAIAHAVLDHMVSRCGCRLLFATHFHPLTTEFAGSPDVLQAHMAAR
jgi:DNA mismatch repair ATPase MutS